MTIGEILKSQEKPQTDDKMKKINELIKIYENIRTEISSWFLKEIEKYKIPNDELLGRKDKEKYMNMIKASNFTSQFYHIPSAQTMMNKMPLRTAEKFDLYFKGYSHTEKIQEFKEIIEEINPDCMGKECWNWELFKKTYVNDEMKKLRE